MTAPAKDTATHGWVGSEPKEVTTKKTEKEVPVAGAAR